MEIQSRKQLTELIDLYNLKVGVELGVNEGEFSAHLLQNSKLETLYSVDAWDTDENKTRSVFRKWATSKGEVSEAHQKTIENLRQFGTRSKLIKALTFDAVREFADNSIDFVYIDASHRFSGVSMDLIQWWDKLKTGGIMAGHDYWKCYRCEVMDAVNGFVVEHKQILHLTTDDLNNRNSPVFPPSFWFQKTLRRKLQFRRDVQKAMPMLCDAQQRLAGYGMQIVLPYQYHDMVVLK